MDWIRDHIQIAFFIGAAIVALVQRAKKAREEKEISSHMPPPAPVTADPDEELRRIREEVMRRRAEREGRPPVPIPQPAPVADEHPFQEDDVRPVFRGERELPLPPPIPNDTERRARRAEEEEEAALERQRVLDAQLRELRQAREQAAAAARAQAESGAFAIDRPAEPGSRLSRGTLLESVRSPAELRRAIILREVLGAPKALQR